MSIISIVEGTDFTQPFRVVDDHTEEPVNLTGATLHWVKFEMGAPVIGVVTPLLTKTIGDGLSIINASSGILQIEFTPEDTEDGDGEYEWEMEVILSNAKTYHTGGFLYVNPARRLDTL